MSEWYIAKKPGCGCIVAVRAVVPEVSGPRGRAEMKWLQETEWAGLIVDGWLEPGEPVVVKCEHTTEGSPDES
jgi:hypothetical protein